MLPFLWTAAALAIALGLGNDHDMPRAAVVAICLAVGYLLEIRNEVRA